LKTIPASPPRIITAGWAGSASCFFISFLYFSWQNETRMPQAISSEKYQAPPKKLLTPIFLATRIPSAYPAADTSVYLQLWAFLLRSFILILLWLVGVYLQLLVFVLHHFFFLITVVHWMTCINPLMIFSVCFL